MFQNLIENAVKFRQDAPPVVRIDADIEDGFHRFCVSDNGIGVDPRHSDRIFSIFQRLHSEQDYPGIGIGLSVCKRIAERHGGRIWVGEDVGDGATFYFTIPVDKGTHLSWRQP